MYVENEAIFPALLMKQQILRPPGLNKSKKLTKELRISAKPCRNSLLCVFAEWKKSHPCLRAEKTTRSREL